MMGWLTMPSYNSRSTFMLSPRPGFKVVFAVVNLGQLPSQPPSEFGDSDTSVAAVAAAAEQNVRRSGSFTRRILIARFPTFS